MTVQRKSTFQACNDKGIVETLHVNVEVIEILGMEGPSTTEGIQTIQTEQGEYVDRLYPGKFRVREGGRILRCDPSNPGVP